MLKRSCKLSIGSFRYAAAGTHNIDRRLTQDIVLLFDSKISPILEGETPEAACIFVIMRLRWRILVHGATKTSWQLKAGGV